MHPVSGQPENQRYYASESLRTAQARLMELSQQLAVQRVQVENYRVSDLTAARDAYSQLQQTRENLVGVLSDVRLLLMEVKETQHAAIAGQLQAGLPYARQDQAVELLPAKLLKPLVRQDGESVLAFHRLPPGGKGHDLLVIELEQFRSTADFLHGKQRIQHNRGFFHKNSSLMSFVLSCSVKAPLCPSEPPPFP